MEHDAIDKVLRNALAPSDCPSEELNDKILKQVKESGVMRRSKLGWIAAACVAAGLLLVPTSVYAAYRYLLPKEAAVELEDERLGEAFDKEGEEVLQTITDGSYTITNLGHVTGEFLSERTGSAWELQPERTYIAVAIERVDGIAMSSKDSIFVSPLIHGLQPWTYNIVTMNGSYMEKVIDGILYRIIECDSIELFADRKLYLAVSDTAFFSTDAYGYDEKSGDITENEAYPGTNILFELSLDSAKADKEKAKEYLNQLEKEWNSSLEMITNDSNQDITDRKKATEEKYARDQKEVITDKGQDISIHIKDNASSIGWSDNEQAQTIFRYYMKVEGEGIESLSYTLNQGEFGYYPRNDYDSWEYNGNKYSVSYEDQEKMGCNYSILLTAPYEKYGYDMKEFSNMGLSVVDKRSQIEYDALNKEIESTTILLEIKMKNNLIIKKTLTLKNQLDYEGRLHYNIELSVE